MASYAYENVRLLQLSKSRSFPNGLSNNSDQLGKHYLSHHQGSPVIALFLTTYTIGMDYPHRALPLTTGRMTILIILN